MFFGPTTPEPSSRRGILKNNRCGDTSQPQQHYHAAQALNLAAIFIALKLLVF
jgi:hypothetical protein